MILQTAVILFCKQITIFLVVVQMLYADDSFYDGDE